jgi:hypothetical protein
VLVRLVSQPSSGFAPEQWAKPETQALGGTKQAPERHSMPVAPPLTFGRLAQLCPHSPQFEGSLWMSTHLVPQRFGVGVVQLEAQEGGLVVRVHSAVGATHVLPH